MEPLILTNNDLDTQKSGSFSIENAFDIPGEGYLKYDYSFIKSVNGKKATYKQKTETFIEALSKTNKLGLPRIDLKSSVGVQGVLADFDSLEDALSIISEGYKKENWADVRRYLSLHFFNGCVFPSASGKAKIFFPVSCPALSTKKSEQMLEELLGSAFRAINTNDRSGMRYSFITKDAYHLLSMWLKNVDFKIALDYNNMICKKYINQVSQNILPIKNKSKDIVVTSSTTETPSDYVWVSSDVEIPENMLDNLKTKNKNVSGAILFALVSKSCITNTGVAIPQDLLAKTIGIPQKAASRLLRTCINLGIFKKVSEYIPHQKAARYCFTGFWLSWASQVVKKAPEGSYSGLKSIIDTIKEGNWNTPLFKMTNYFSNEQDYMNKVESLPNYDEKPERARQAKNAWTSHIKKDSKKVKELKYA